MKLKLVKHDGDHGTVVFHPITTPPAGGVAHIAMMRAGTLHSALNSRDLGSHVDWHFYAADGSAVALVMGLPDAMRVVDGLTDDWPRRRREQAQVLRQLADQLEGKVSK